MRVLSKVPSCHWRVHRLCCPFFTEHTSGQIREPLAVQLFSHMRSSQHGEHSLHSFGYGLDIVWLARATSQYVRAKFQLPHEVPCLSSPGVVTHSLAFRPSISQYSFSNFDVPVLEGMQLLCVHATLHFGALLQLELLLFISVRWLFASSICTVWGPVYIQTTNHVLGAY